MSGERFTSWLSEGERKALRELARELNMSENAIVRTALRALLFGKPIPGYMRDTLARGNRSNTSNTTTGARA